MARIGQTKLLHMLDADQFVIMDESTGEEIALNREELIGFCKMSLHFLGIDATDDGT